MDNNSIACAGIDTGKDKLDVAQQGTGVVVFPPRQVRAHALYRLRHAKNDRIDAAPAR